MNIFRETTENNFLFLPEFWASEGVRCRTSQDALLVKGLAGMTKEWLGCVKQDQGTSAW